MLNAYLHAISLIERMHRQFLDVVKAELDGQRIRDINNVQAPGSCSTSARMS